MCSLVLPWGIVTLLSLKTSVLTRLLVTTFNLYYLMIQITVLLVSIGLVAERPAIVTLICPAMISTIFVDAVPQVCRRYVTFISLFMMMCFTISFVVAMLCSLLDISNELAFEINSMELSGKALAFTCSLNLLAFSLRSILICIFHPGCLVFYTCNVKSKRYDPEKRISSFWGGKDDGENKNLEEKKNDDETKKKDSKLYWTVRPKFKTEVIRTKETLAAVFFGHRANSCLWATAKNVRSHTLTLETPHFNRTHTRTHSRSHSYSRFLDLS